ncbi:aminopeptidase P family protein [Tahibacter amnicola]|uniref:Aminopeptidase P family protein n=1 Tax=Tahibacter amnicola TaxID=2976241 RepID=A0ABY6BMB4_9GAMM|nr:aminopeptidase P family protein [Tahibacter amnicola]UXI69701.1 aminopeptidase P family protein [Tahibacter amnicola]
MSIPERIDALRQILHAEGVAALVVPSADPHLSEYLPARWQARQWLSGFGGSAGTLVVTAEFAGLWTDSRYFEQAAQELDGSGITLMRQGNPGIPDHAAWIAGNTPADATVAVAGDTLSLAAQDQLRRQFENERRLRTDLDPVDRIWTDRPARPAHPVRAHEPAYLSTTRAERLARVRTAMREKDATHHLVSALDDVAWITGLRGTDVAYNPVFLAHLLIGPEHSTLFIDPGKIADELAAELARDGIHLAPYDTLPPALAHLPADARLWLDPRRIVAAIAEAAPASVRQIRHPNPSQAFKAAKSREELAHIRQTMRHDGVALVRFLRWLEEQLARGQPLTELDIDAALRHERSRQPGFVGESFATIAGYLANGALPHYRATPTQHAALRAEGLLLVDSGGQYEGGTTDITRTIALGPTTTEQRSDYTLVLKGMIALSHARFPRGTTGQQLDALARAPIWAAGINYGHGTGHGVGYFLNVHEGPQSIRPSSAEPPVALVEGMVTSNEPGIYRPGRHGVRIENLLATVAAGTTEFGEFLSFETLTLCPIDTRPIVREQLDGAEVDWLNRYHRTVLDGVGPLLTPDEKDWLARRCEPL